jgi:type IV secretion system protein VirB4
LAPLKRLTDDEADLRFLSNLIRACISTPKEYEFTPEEDRRLGIALRHVMRLPPERRCVGEIRAFLGTNRSGAGARLEKWCWGQEYGWVIDCPRDVVDLSNRLNAFDQSSVLNDRIAAGAIMATLFHYTEKLADGRRLVLVLDEVWNALRIPQFHATIRNGLATYGKYNVPIIIGTQSPRDALDSPIAHVIREQCSQIHFGNPNAVWADYGPDGLNRSEKEFAIVKSLPLGTGRFLLCQEDRSNVLELPLAGFSHVKVISGTRTGLDALALARKRTEDAVGATLVDAYHEALEELTQ